MRRVLVTGASRGIGAAIAKRMARDGFQVTINYREREDAAKAVADEIRESGGQSNLLRFDVANRKEVRIACGALEARNTAVVTQSLSLPRSP